jgi:hypothetical protein
MPSAAKPCVAIRKCRFVVSPGRSVGNVNMWAGLVPDDAVMPCPATNSCPPADVKSSTNWTFPVESE